MALVSLLFFSIKILLEIKNFIYLQNLHIFCEINYYVLMTSLAVRQ